MLNIEFSTKIDSFFNDKVSVSDFECWIHENYSLEQELGETLYLDLISLNYKNQNIKYQLKELIGHLINYESLHKIQILEILNNLKNHEGNAKSHIHQLYQYAIIGNDFLAETTVIANYDEQGKSILYFFYKKEESQYWDIIHKFDNTFFNWVEKTILTL